MCLYTVNPPICPAALIQKHLIFCSLYQRVALISKLNEKRTEIMCQNLFTGRIVQNVAEIIILFVLFFPNITSKYVYQPSEKTLFLSVFYCFGVRDPHFQEIRFFVFVRTVGSSLY